MIVTVTWLYWHIGVKRHWQSHQEWTGAIYIYCRTTLTIQRNTPSAFCVDATYWTVGLQFQNSECHAWLHFRELPQLLLFPPCFQNPDAEVNIEGHPCVMMETWQQGMLEHHIFSCIYLFKLCGLPHPTPNTFPFATYQLEPSDTHTHTMISAGKEEKREQMHFRKRTGNRHWNGHYRAWQFHLWFQLLLQVYAMNVAWLP